MTSRLHDDLVRDIVKREGAQTAGWRRAYFECVREHPGPQPRKAEPCATECGGCDQCKRSSVYWHWQDLMGCSARPDAYVIDVEAEVIRFFEAQVTHPLSRGQLDAYIDTFWFVDGEGWQMELWIVDRCGGRMQVDICAIAIGEIPPRHWMRAREFPETELGKQIRRQMGLPGRLPA